jgi:hypothetical protein
LGTDPALRCVTGSLEVVYKRPTPIGVPLEIRGRIEEITAGGSPTGLPAR